MNKERARDRAAKIVASNWRIQKRLPRISKLIADLQGQKPTRK